MTKALIKNTPPEYFEKTLELLDQHFRDENYSEKAIYYDLAARCVDIVWQYSTAMKDSLLLAAEHGLRPEDITVKTVKGSEI